MQIQTIGSYEAKTRLPELLRQVQAGQEFEISVRGRAVAKLSRLTSPEQQRGLAVAKMRAFMQAQQTSNAGAALSLRDLIDEGRA